MQPEQSLHRADMERRNNNERKRKRFLHRAMTPQEQQWQRVKDYDHEIIRTHWGSDEPGIGGSEEGQDKFGPSLFESIVLEKETQTYRGRPQNYWLASVIEGRLVFDSWDTAIKDFNYKNAVIKFHNQRIK